MAPGGWNEPEYRVTMPRTRPATPQATNAILIVLVLVFLYELFIFDRYGDAVAGRIFAIYRDWPLRPWSLVTSTLSHGSWNHLFFNGLFLYFFGPTIEGVVGAKRYALFFVLSGAVSGVVQATLSDHPALGASGALMGLLGVSLILMPKSQMIIFPLPVPIPLWVGGILYAVLDVLGAFNPASAIGNFAHLSGLALGLLYGLRIQKDMRRRGLRLIYR